MGNIQPLTIKEGTTSIEITETILHEVQDKITLVDNAVTALAKALDTLPVIVRILSKHEQDEIKETPTKRRTEDTVLTTMIECISENKIIMVESVRKLLVLLIAKGEEYVENKNECFPMLKLNSYAQNQRGESKPSDFIADFLEKALDNMKQEADFLNTVIESQKAEIDVLTTREKMFNAEVQKEKAQCETLKEKLNRITEAMETRESNHLPKETNPEQCKTADEDPVRVRGVDREKKTETVKVKNETESECSGNNVQLYVKRSTETSLVRKNSMIALENMPLSEPVSAEEVIHPLSKTYQQSDKPNGPTEQSLPVGAIKGQKVLSVQVYCKKDEFNSKEAEQEVFQRLMETFANQGIHLKKQEAGAKEIKPDLPLLIWCEHRTSNYFIRDKTVANVLRGLKEISKKMAVVMFHRTGKSNLQKEISSSKDKNAEIGGVYHIGYDTAVYSCPSNDENIDKIVKFIKEEGKEEENYIGTAV